MIEKPVFKNNAYWLGKENGSIDGPYCMKCYDDERNYIRLNRLYPKEYNYECPKCKNHYRQVTPPKKIEPVEE